MSLRTAGAIVLGFVLVTIGVASGALASGPSVSAGGRLTVLALGLAMYVLAGWSTARIAPAAPLHHAAVLAAISAFMAVVMLLPGSDPFASVQLLSLLAMLIGIPAGAAVGARR